MINPNNNQGVIIKTFAQKIEKKIYSDDWTGNEFKNQEEQLNALLSDARSSEALKSIFTKK